MERSKKTSTWWFIYPKHRDTSTGEVLIGFGDRLFRNMITPFTTRMREVGVYVRTFM